MKSNRSSKDEAILKLK
jgi:ATP adenylyltransferase/5',5'''-P-1,P-4-tetraphosphate phosphorylase II